MRRLLLRISRTITNIAIPLTAALLASATLLHPLVGQTHAAYWNKMKADKILFLGNSITLHSPAPNIGWTGNWGMAATEMAKDYVHLLTTKIDATTGGELPIAASGSGGDDNIVNIWATFEKGYATYENSSIQTQMDYGADIVVLQFGENMPSPNTTAAQTLFQSKLELLMDGLQSNGDPTIFVTSLVLLPDATIDAIKRTVCSEDPTHRIFVDLGGFRNDSSNRAASEGVFANSDVAWHPGNHGMQYIADHLYSAIETQSIVPEPSSFVILATLGVSLWAFARRKTFHL